MLADYVIKINVVVVLKHLVLLVDLKVYKATNTAFSIIL